MTEHYLSGAKWTLKNDSFEYKGTLDENGRTDLNNIALGTYKFTLSKDGYETKKSMIVIGSDPIDIKAELEPLPKSTPKKEPKTVEKEAVDEVKEEKESAKPKKESKTKTTTKKKTASKKKSTKKTAKKDKVEDKESSKKEEK